MIGIIVAVGVAVAAGIAAWGWGQGKTAELTKRGEGEKEFWSKQLGWVIIAITSIITIAFIAWYLIKTHEDKKGVPPK